MHTWHLHIRGIVQGVGFRPHVYRMAKEYGLAGWVNNTVDGVHVRFNASRGMARVFQRDLLERAPALSHITDSSLEQLPQEDFDDFRVMHSDDSGHATLLITPDFALCDDCRKESHRAADRRYSYAFITCTNCGPRYSITRKLPYDRHTTTMDRFTMCAACRQEYNDPLDRRYYSQTNSCPDCPVGLQLFVGGVEAGPAMTEQDMIREVVVAWQEGKIAAIKGIGGYLLTCSAGDEVVIQKLRDRKHRPAKPFALMYPSLDMLKNDAEISGPEANALQGVAAPILLLDLKPGHSLAADAIAPGLQRIGAMLPYTPLFDQLLKQYGAPIVATSGNVSNSPIIFDDEKAVTELGGIADLILANDRKIVVPQDDSVIRYSSRHAHRIIIRRSRGMAPTYISSGNGFLKQTLFAAGAMLKSTFAYVKSGNCYVSQYLGDTSSFDTQETYRHTFDHFMSLFSEKPTVVLADMHPQYFATEEARRMANTYGAPLFSYQHHIAHFAAVLGEHNKLAVKEPVLGVIWDGTGYGEDGHIWGGEFFLFSDGEFERLSHFRYFPSIAGDKMAREPRISLLSAGHGSLKIKDYVQGKFTGAEWSVYSGKLEKPDGLKTSSAGRLFDAAACLCGLLDVSTYEGEAAMYLEAAAAAAYYVEGAPETDGYQSVLDEVEQGGMLQTELLLEAMLEELENGRPVDEVALKFHATMAEIIRLVVERAGVKMVAFSGGVFQNSVILDLLNDRLAGQYDLLFHDQLSPNDEAVSFGQLMCYCIEKARE
jgi:hydrogenase maturation protein HypF